ncbi:hypothetical protein F5Y18DRAFT_387005 [Xylariaceae sp. FL1019]|nr:hypothetical protein F5Y18DRAFT_387005 [Xylariaceae sp. FL1019]
MTTFAAFTPRQTGDTWFCAGLASSFADITEPVIEGLYEAQPCGNDKVSPGCKVFAVPSGDGSKASQIEGDDMTSHNGDALQDQVLIFQYKGKFHAVDNKCPHSSYPLAKGTPFDIEDFGVVLSTGITCPKHGWSFDLFTGRADRSSYMLRTWEVQLRPSTDKAESEEVWVGKKQRKG